MKSKQVKQLLVAMINAGLPALITGAPGIGKSDIFKQAADEAGADLMISHPVVNDPTDAKGFPWPNAETQTATFLPFGDLARALAATKPLLWALDDLGQATPAVQASYMQLLLAREVNGHKLPDCVTFVAATNRRVDRAGVTGILEPVKSRFATIVELEVDVDSWLEWAAALGDIAPEVMAFIRLQPDVLHDFKPSADMSNSPCPRTWKRVSDLLKLGLPEQIEMSAFAGAVGIGAASAFCGFLKLYREMPAIDEILIDPKGAAVPKETSGLWAVATGLANAATAANFDRVLIYAERLPQEYGICCVRDAQRRNKEVIRTKAWAKYATGPLGRAVVGDVS